MHTQADNHFRGAGNAILCLLLLTALTATTICAQEPSAKQKVQRGIPISELRTAPGRLVARGKNDLPVGPLGLKTYRLEEVKLDEPIEVPLRGRRRQLGSVFRLTVTAESFRNEDVTIWIDDEPLFTPAGLTEATTLIFDRGLLQEGATISVSRVRRDEGDLRTTLPERLELPEHLRVALFSADDKKPQIRLRRIASSPRLQNQPGIELLLTGDATYPPGNAFLFVSIGDQDFSICGDGANGDPYTLVCHFTEQAFAQLKDGDSIRAKYGRGPRVPSYQRFGRLDKSLLER